jgi:hypothetical protein
VLLEGARESSSAASPDGKALWPKSGGARKGKEDGLADRGHRLTAASNFTGRAILSVRHWNQTMI